MDKPFNLTRWFLPVAMLVTLAVGICTPLLISRLLVDDMVRRDARVNMEFIQSITAVEHPEDYFTGVKPADRRLVDFFNHIATMPNVLRANVFAGDRRILWSSDANLIGMAFAHNPELEAALRGELVTSKEVRWKPEHMLMGVREDGFVEHYLPVYSQGRVIGVVELYKNERALLESINGGLRLVWLGSLGGGVVLYLVLVGLVRRADRTMQARHARQLESTTSAALATLASAVEQGPLAAIRARAAMGLESPSPVEREANEEILFEVERLQRWLRDLQDDAADDTADAGPSEVPSLLRDSLPLLDPPLKGA